MFAQTLLYCYYVSRQECSSKIFLPDRKMFHNSKNCNFVPVAETFRSKRGSSFLSVEVLLSKSINSKCFYAKANAGKKTFQNVLAWKELWVQVFVSHHEKFHTEIFPYECVFSLNLLKRRVRNHVRNTFAVGN